MNEAARTDGKDAREEEERSTSGVLMSLGPKRRTCMFDLIGKNK